MSSFNHFVRLPAQAEDWKKSTILSDLRSNIEEGVTRNESKKEDLFFNLSTVIGYLLEYIALFDFLTDINVTRQLIFSKNTMWAAITVNAMIAPFLASSIQMIEFLLQKVIWRD